MERKLVLRVLLGRQKQSDVMVICALYSQKKIPYPLLLVAQCVDAGFLWVAVCFLLHVYCIVLVCKKSNGELLINTVTVV